MRSVALRVWLVLPLIATALAVGCGGRDLPPTYEVTGTVTLDDKPVEGARVTFVPIGEGDAATGETNASGEYSLRSFGTERGAPAGKYTVRIVKFEYDDAGSGGGSAPPDDYNPKAAKRDSGKKSALPKKYSSPRDSGLRATVTEDESKNVFDFKLES